MRSDQPRLLGDAAVLSAPIEQITLGVDVARSGSDETVVYLRRGGVIRLVHRAPRPRHDAHRGDGGELPASPGARAIIDTIGIGAGVYDRLREQGLEVCPFQGSERAYKPGRFRESPRRELLAASRAVPRGANRLADIAANQDC